MRSSRLPLMAILLLSWSISCSPQADQRAALKSVADTPDAQAQNPLSTLSQLQRFIGQTSFLTVAPQLSIIEQAEVEGDSSAKVDGERDIQEADLFKTGVPGSKLIYILNQYRGLQVVDFSQGEAAPRLLGRSAATGNEPLEMYFDAPHLQLIILERGWDGQAAYGSIDKMLVYSVVDPLKPKLMQSIELDGSLADSRMVGNVLYVATSRWSFFPDGSSPSGDGKVTAYRFLDQGLSPVAAYQLNLPVSALKNMNIVQSSEGGSERFYLISVLAENRLNWVDRKSTIEVLDISDPEGAIRPLLLASMAGEIDERSSTQIKDGTLLAVSNSVLIKDDGTQQLKVTVEGFKLPTSESSSIDPAEAAFRQAWFEREMLKKPAEEDAAAYAAKLQSNPELGLKGVFVKQGTGTLAKILPDQSITVGDDSGEHADLQDVRFVGDKLYVFWVPANKVDPLDVFDIRDPGNNLVYLGRTLFEGWIERAIPLQHNGQDFILALGWINPPAGTEGQRYPQAILFGATAQSYQSLGQLTLSESDLGAYLNDEDKSIVVQSKLDGTGAIIFPTTVSRDDRVQSGGKMISYNLNATSPQDYLIEGPLLASDGEWLRRIIENPELEKVHTLSDRALSTYSLALSIPGPSSATAKPNQLVKALSILELARNIVAYTTIQVGDKKLGVQIIDKGLLVENKAQTALRLVDPLHADAELPQTRLPRVLAGRYEGHLLAQDGSLLVLTSRDLSLPEGEYDSWLQELRLARLTWSPQGEIAISSKSQTLIWQEKGAYSDSRSKISPGASRELYQLRQLASGEIMLTRDRNVRFFTSQDKLSIKTVSDPLACLPVSAKELKFLRLNAADYVSYALPVSSDEIEYAQIRFLQHFVAPLHDNVVDCTRSINIPGRPVRIEGEQLITEEDRFLGFDIPVEDQSGPISASVGGVIDRFFSQRQLWPETIRVLHALQLAENKATLSDIYSLEAVRSSLLSQASGLYFMEQPQGWGSRFLAKLSLDPSGRFVRKSLLLPLATVPGEDVRLLKVLETSEDSPYFLMQAQRQAYLLKEDSGLLKAVTLRFGGDVVLSTEPQKSFPLYNWLEGDNKIDSRLNFDPLGYRLSFAQGLWGVQEIEILRGEALL